MKFQAYKVATDVCNYYTIYIIRIFKYAHANCFQITQAVTEGKIMTEFKELVTQGREQFAKELKSILPNVDSKIKGQYGCRH